MKTIALLGIVLGMFGCGGGDGGTSDSCYVPPTSNIVFGDCKKKMADGTECVTECGQLPQDGSQGMSLPIDCQVPIGTSAPETGTCVASCSDCK